MKRCSKVSGWTDYPFSQLGDLPGEPALIRHVEVVSYDGDKYATIKVEDMVLEVKSGYLYRAKGRYGEVKVMNRRKLERMKSTITKEGTI